MKEGINMVTYSELFEYTTMLIAFATLIWCMSKRK